MRHSPSTEYFTRNALVGAAAAVCLSVSVQAQVEPKEVADDTWISITGTVTSTTDNSFKLDFGQELITVDMDGWDDFGDAYPLTDGDKVTVHGNVDHDFFEKATIEASGLFIDGVNSFFYASSEDEDAYGEWVIDVDTDLGDVTYIGTVEAVNPSTNTFTIDTGAAELSVDTSGLFYNLLDDEGFQQIDAGDRVSVEAVIDSDFINDQDLLATSVVTLSN